MQSSLDDIVQYQNWSPKAKEAALAKIKRELARNPQEWWCDYDRNEDGTIWVDEHGFPRHGRFCDGRPHPGYDYPHARADQWPPPLSLPWSVWLSISGRGAGKTKSGAEWSIEQTNMTPQVGMCGRRGIDVRQVMVEGPSGLIVACERRGISYDWKINTREFVLGNGAKILGYSAEEPASLRGPEHGAFWLDEPAHMDLIEDVWDNMIFGLRMKGIPGGARILCTSTPLPTKWLKNLILEDSTFKVVVPTYVNLDNLDPGFRARLLDKYEHTRKGRQELEGEILEDVEGALWEYEWIDKNRSSYSKFAGVWDKIVVAIDPAGTANRRSDETGIIVCGKIGREYFVLEDLSGKYTPEGWAKIAINAYVAWEANEIIAENNFGGDMVKSTITTKATEMERKGELTGGVKVTVLHAQRSKQLRAEPVTALYERKHVHHNGKFPELEEEQLTWVPGKGDSPNRVDACVWGINHLAGKTKPAAIGRASGNLPQRRPGGLGRSRASVYSPNRR